MPTTQLKGGTELRKTLRKFEPDLAKALQTDMKNALKGVVTRARGYVPVEPPLSGWGKVNKQGRFPSYNAREAKSGIGYRTTPTKPNRRGFSYLASINNKGRSGSIFETAGRKNPEGRAPVMSRFLQENGSVMGYEGKRSGKVRSMRDYRSNNPFAGYQFVSAIKSVSLMKSVGRGRKNQGRLIFRAWAEDQGKANAAVIKAIQTAAMKFNKKGSF